ncbi:MAG TPA: Fe-Mn family superoxide dismutase [Methylomirabilota bacterium]|nr:Fe-Mn family superoxide dismutase [Methylomirabilota bacterium]
MLIGGAAMAEAGGESGGAVARGEAFRGNHVPKPLPFDPKKLPGLSEKLLVSHHDKNYAGAVKNLNDVEAALAKVGADTPGFTVAGLEAAKLKFTNSMILHELYFANLGGGGGGGAAGSETERVLLQAYGSLPRWEQAFRALGNALGGGSGWAILDWDFHAHGPRIYWAGDHTNALSLGAPLLVMDMYEHAYAMDYGASAKEYIEAFFKNVQWAEVERRLGRAQKADAALRG